MSEESTAEDVVPSPLESVIEYLAQLQSRIQPLTRTAAQLPGPSDLSFHRSLDRSLVKELDSSREEIVEALNSLLAGISGKGTKGSSKLKADDGWNLRADDLLDGNSFSRKLGDIVDTLLEKADTRLDEYQGKTKPASENTKSRAEKSRSGDASGTVPSIGPLPPFILNANIQPLPQSKFSKKPDNSRERLWKHHLVEKPHAKVPLTWTTPPPAPGEPSPIIGTRQGMYCAEGDPRDNPYYFEINNYQPPNFSVEVLPQFDDLVPPPPLQKAEPTSGAIPFLWVDDETSFETLFDHLMEERVKEVAIDVEHHNYRSFQGLVCLVQISTRWQDFIIDALSPVIRNISQRLNRVFADQNKVKILHGAEHDILWLQRDLGLYVVGLFDTYHATNVLNFPQHSLAFLLSRYIHFEADKRYQLADWRIRPLNDEMMFYARSDTHSLIYVYDCLRFEIAKSEGEDGIKQVFELSKRTASKTYAKEEWDPSGEGREGWKSLWKRMGGVESVGVDERWEREGVDGLNKTERLFQALHDWRDQVARKEDESARFILPTNNLLNLSSRAPDTPEAVLPCVGPAFKKRAADVAQLISAENKALKESQRKKGESERAKLKGTRGGQIDEEMGEVINRDVGGGAALQSLWPANESSRSSSQVKSAIASLLFGGNQSEAGAEDGKIGKSSLFAPLPKTLTNLKIMTGIKSDFASALRGILGKKGCNDDDQGVAEEVADMSQSDSFKLDSAQDQVNVGRILEERSESAADAEEGENDRILKIKKDTKKRSATDDQTTSSKEKKPKWTKEQKEQRRKDRESNDAATVEPFDYSNAKSVLDTKPTIPVKDESGKAKNKKRDKQDKSKKEGVSKAANSKEDKARYANISVRRDRREQQGGKSMSFQQ
ncbi:hypothetical protein CBS101457_001431 [Exobasidium rhododendri]|nr:hypothetical protein CBS101457_001431 [Exobasidium rhododendri]